MKVTRRKWWKWAALLGVPIVPLWIIRAQQSWLPRKIGDLPSSYYELPVASLVWSQDGKGLAINYIPVRRINLEGDGEYTEEIQIWDVAHQLLIRRLHPYGDAAVPSYPWLTLSPDSRYFATNTEDELKRTTETRTIDARTGEITGTAFRRYNPRAASTKLLAHCWSSDGLSLRTVYAERNDAVARAYFKVHAKMDGIFEFPDKNSRRGDIVEEQHDWRTGNLQKRITLTHNGLRGGPNNLGNRKTYENAIFSQDGKRLALIPGNPQGGLAKHILIYDVATGAQTMLHLPYPAFGRALVLAPLGLADKKDAVAILTSARDIEIWNYHSGSTICKMHLTKGGVRSLTFSPDGSLLASSSETVQEGISLWDATTGHLLRTIGKDAKRENYAFTQMAFSPDSATLAVTNEDSTITLWRVK